ncbi:hypothetical protein CH35J_009057 [Colletotrichum higginsianum]|uniref:Uncharacterized protein n=1 Tax=Colletotrichum higginsianum TaxID=80884 RepID=A0A4T0VP48_9PEZI|nr:hypothetical protein CH35J_009057 [Colletotrichum higginsianum]
MKAAPDIGGRGAVMVLIVRAFVTLCLAIFYLVVGRTNQDRQAFNPIDRFARKHVSEPARRLTFRLGMDPDLHSLVAYDLVNTFSDLQLVTGLVVLVDGIKELGDGSALGKPKTGSPWGMMVINMTLMPYCYAVQIFLSWRTGRLWWMDYEVDREQGVWYFLASEVETMLGLSTYLGFGVYSLADDRIRGRVEMEQDVQHEEDELVFSQLVSLFLLIIPFMGLFESYTRHSKAIEESDAKELDSCPSEGP